MKKFVSLKNQVYDYIVDQIRCGHLKSGDKINEAMLTEKLSVSRTPIREALIELATDDVIENVPRKGFVVKYLSTEDTKKLYDIIGLLDGYIARSVCFQITEKELKSMDFFLQSINLAIGTENFDMYMKLKDEFHDCYIRLYRNDMLTEALDKYKSKLLRNNLFSNDVEKIKDVLLGINEEHKEILKLFQKKDADGLFDYIKNVHWNPENAYLDELL